MVRYVYDFQGSGRDLSGRLGGRGANLAEMARVGLPIPLGLIVATEACRTFLAAGEEPEGMPAEVSRHLAALEAGAGRLPGQGDDSLLLSVRSGARFSVPGMLETVLDIGLNDDSVLGLAKPAGSERFAWDSHRQVVQMYGSTVMGDDADTRDVELLAAVNRMHEENPMLARPGGCGPTGPGRRQRGSRCPTGRRHRRPRRARRRPGVPPLLPRGRPGQA